MLNAKTEKPLRVLAVAHWNYDGNPHPWAIQRIQSLRDAGVRVDVLAEDCISDRRGYLRLWRELNRRLTDSPYDVVAPLYGSLLGLLSVMQRKAPVALHFAGSDINGRPTPGRISLHSLSVPISQLSAALARGVAVTNPRMREALWWPPSRRSARVIQDGIDTEHFRPTPQAEARRRRGLPPNGVRVAFVVLNRGSEDRRRYKRLDLARQAVAQVPGATLDLLEELPFSEMPAAYAAANALVLTSIAEGSPNCVKEALACGIPVIATDAGDVRELISGLTNCAVVPPQPEALAHALAAAIADGRGCPEGPEQMRKHSLQVTVKEFVSFYSAVAGIEAA